MREMNIDHGQFSSLVKFSRQYRVAVPIEAEFPYKLANNAEAGKEIRLAAKLAGKDSLENQLLTDIVGHPIQRIGVTAGDDHLADLQQRVNPSEEMSHSEDMDH